MHLGCGKQHNHWEYCWALVDDYLQAIRGTGTEAVANLESKQGDKGKTKSRKRHKYKQVGHIMRECPQKKSHLK